jgi:hypothetical protein
VHVAPNAPRRGEARRKKLRLPRETFYAFFPSAFAEHRSQSGSHADVQRSVVARAKHCVRLHMSSWYTTFAKGSTFFNKTSSVAHTKMVVVKLRLHRSRTNCSTGVTKNWCTVKQTFASTDVFVFVFVFVSAPAHARSMQESTHESTHASMHMSTLRALAGGRNSVPQPPTTTVNGIATGLFQVVQAF